MELSEPFAMITFDVVCGTVLSGEVLVRFIYVYAAGEYLSPYLLS